MRLFLKDIPYLEKLCNRKVTTRIDENFMWFCFCFILQLHNILMKSIIPFFIHSFHVLTLVYEQEKSKNNMTYI